MHLMLTMILGVMKRSANAYWPSKSGFFFWTNAIKGWEYDLIRVVKINAITPKKSLAAVFLSICVTTKR